MREEEGARQAKRLASYCSFDLGLRMKKWGALRIKHVLGVNGNLHKLVNLTDSMTKGSKQQNACLSVKFRAVIVPVAEWPCSAPGTASLLAEPMRGKNAPFALDGLTLRR